jgi:hypothetical protein
MSTTMPGKLWPGSNSTKNARATWARYALQWIEKAAWRRMHSAPRPAGPIMAPVGAMPATLTPVLLSRRFWLVTVSTYCSPVEQNTAPAFPNVADR